MYNYRLKITILKSYLTTTITILKCYITNTSSLVPAMARIESGSTFHVFAAEVPKRPKTIDQRA